LLAGVVAGVVAGCIPGNFNWSPEIYLINLDFQLPVSRDLSDLIAGIWYDSD